MKKFISSVLAGCLVLSCSAITETKAAVEVFDEPVIEDAAVEVFDEPVIEDANEATPEKMEQMIKKVRPLIDVPEDFDVFEWDFNAASVYSAASWRFSWANYEKGEISVSCDNMGNIFSYRYYDYQSERSYIVPEVSPDTYTETVKAFIEKTAPYSKDMDLRPDAINVGSIYSPTYTYYFTRYENGIPVPEEEISVTYDYSSQIITRMSSSVSINVEFSEPQDIITSEKAKEILAENQSMILSYRLKTEYDDEGNLISRKAYLVYTPEIGYISVDAETGEVYTERNSWNINKAPTAGGAYGDIMMDSSSSKEESADMENGGYQLSEEELAQLAVLESLITKDEAIKVVTSNDYLYIDPMATVIKAYLSKDRYGYKPVNADSDEDSYIWHINFSAPETLGDDYPFYYHSMSASVDASTGELISFYAEVPDYYYYKETEKPVPALNYTEKQAEDMAFNFVKAMQPDKADNVRLSSNFANIPITYVEDADGNRTPVYGSARMSFVRQNEGVDFTYNSIRVSIDLVSGKVTNYNYTWYDDVDFESPDDVIDAKQALMSLYSYDGFGINYEVNANYTYNEYLTKEYNGEYINYDELFDTVFYSRAVYSAYNPGTTTIRALDGKMIDYNGEEYKDYSFFNKYDDIESHWAKNAIERLSWMGVGSDETSFNPDSPISSEDFEVLCSSLGLYGGKFEIDAYESLTRMDAVKYIIHCLGYSKVAELENVFITDFADNSDFLAQDIGYAAIARGFGLIQGDGENFRPYDTLTRAEAYTIAVNTADLGML